MDGRPALDRQKARLARLIGGGLLGLALSVAVVSLLLPLAVRGFVRIIELIMNVCVWFAMSLSVGVSVWSLLATFGRTAADVITTRQASLGLTVLVVIAALAAYGLQRLLGSE